MISRTTHPNYIRTDEYVESYDSETLTHYRFTVDETTGQLLASQSPDTFPFHSDINLDLENS